jgi:hypothetical protein
MSVATFNASAFSAGETIAFTSRGGDFTSAATVIPSAGTDGSPITYVGEPGYIPTLANVAAPSQLTVGKSYVTISDINVSGGGYGLHIPTGTYAGITTNNLIVSGQGSECVRHEGTVDITHNNITLTVTPTTDALTTHSIAGGTITLNNPIVSGYGNGGAVRGISTSTTNWEIYGGAFTAGTGGIFISNTNRSTGTYVIDGVTIVDAGSSRGWDLRAAGVLTLTNCIISGTAGDFYILPNTGSKIYNNTFYNMTVTNTMIFNNVAMTIKNNIFDTVSVKALYGSTGTIDYNAFFNSGTAQGTNIVATDPALDVNGKLTASSTAMFDAGIGPSSDANVPATDIDGDTRSGTTTDMGADQY